MVLRLLPPDTQKTFCNENPPPSYEEATGQGPHAQPDTLKSGALSLSFPILWRSLDRLRSLFDPAKRGADSTVDDDICHASAVPEDSTAQAADEDSDRFQKIANFRTVLNLQRIKGKEVACIACMGNHPNDRGKLTGHCLTDPGNAGEAMLWTGPNCPTGQSTFFMKDPIITFWGAHLIMKSSPLPAWIKVKEFDAVAYWRNNGWNYRRFFKVIQGRLLLAVFSDSPVGDLDALVQNDGFHQNVQMCAHVKSSRSLSSWFSDALARLDEAQSLKKAQKYVTISVL